RLVHDRRRDPRHSLPRRSRPRQDRRAHPERRRRDREPPEDGLGVLRAVRRSRADGRGHRARQEAGASVRRVARGRVRPLGDLLRRAVQAGSPGSRASDRGEAVGGRAGGARTVGGSRAGDDEGGAAVSRFAIGLLLAWTACRDTSEPARLSPPATLSSSTSPEPAWLPVGTTVPRGQAIPAPPQPYDPLIQGPELPKPTDEVNLARRPGFVAPPKGVPTNGAAAPRGEAYRGLRWGQISAQWYGASSVYDVQPSLALPRARPSRGGVWRYAPTTLPTWSACIEVSQVYQRLAGEIATGKYFGLWDWCESGPDGKFAVFEPE